MKVTIVGLGLIGGSIAIDIRAKGFASEIIGVDNNPEHVKQAKSRGLCDDILPLKSAVKGADLVVLAIPVNAILKTLPEVLNGLSPKGSVTDMGSTKSEIIKSISKHKKRKQYVASHPMAGTEFSGPLAAVRGLFENRTTVICDAENSNADSLRKVDALYDALGMRKVYMSSSEHDLHAAYISHLSHISSFALANAVLDKERDVGTIFNLAGGGFESTVRLAKSSPAMWNPIFEQNREHILSALNLYLHHLEEFRDTLKKNKPERTFKLMDNANSIRRVLQNIKVAK